MSLNNIWENLKVGIADSFEGMKNDDGIFSKQKIQNETGITNLNKNSLSDYLKGVLGIGINKLRQTELGTELEAQVIESGKKEAVYSTFNSVINFLKGPFGIISLIVAALLLFRGALK